VAEGSESFRAAEREQFYVSASRFKEALRIYTDDKRQLLDAVSKSSARPSATDLIVKRLPEPGGRTETEKQGIRQISAKRSEESSKQTQVRKNKGVSTHKRPPALPPCHEIAR